MNNTVILFSYLISRYYNIVIINEYFRSQSDHRKGITLPPNWIIPETIQKCTYRNPWVIATKELIKSKIFKPHNNLDPNLKERKILRVTYVKYAPIFILLVQDTSSLQNTIFSTEPEILNILAQSELRRKGLQGNQI